MLTQTETAPPNAVLRLPPVAERAVAGSAALFAAGAARIVLAAHQHFPVSNIRGAQDRLLLVRCRQGACRLVAGTLVRDCLPGSLLVLDGQAGGRFEADGPCDLAFLTLPRIALRDRCRRIELIHGSVVPLQPGQALLFDGLLASAATPQPDALARAIGDAALALLEAEPPCNASSTGAALTLARARSLAASRLADPELGAASLARALGISERYLRTLFAGTGQSPARFILNLRLERSHRLLCDPARDRLSIAEIAFSCGFVSQAHFSRLYRARYGDAPRSTRLRRA